MNNDQLSKLKDRIPYNENLFESEELYVSKLKGLLEDSKNIALSILYPFLDDYDDVELPSKYSNWQIRASLEIYKWEGNQGVKSYSELNLAWSRGNDGVLSNALLEELVPKASAPKRIRSDSVDSQ